MRTSLRILFFLLLLGIVSNGTAQSLQGGLDFLVGLPQGEFKRNVDKTGWGIIGNFGYAPDGAPIMIGIEGGFMNYGSTDRDEPFSTTIPNVFVRVSTTNNIVLGHAILRLQPNTGTIRPYLQGMAGVNYLFTRTSIKNSYGSGDEIAGSDDLHDAVFSYGGGAGLMVVIYRPDEGKISDVFLDLGVRYVFGGEADYLKEGSIRSESGRVHYDVIRSKTDLVEFQLGVAVRF